jgi:hypothetical protein
MFRPDSIVSGVFGQEVPGFFVLVTADSTASKGVNGVIARNFLILARQNALGESRNAVSARVNGVVS